MERKSYIKLNNEDLECRASERPIKKTDLVYIHIQSEPFGFQCWSEIYSHPYV